MSNQGMDRAGAALVVAAVMVFAFAGWVAFRPMEPPANAGSTLGEAAPTEAPEPVVVVLGDSFTGGSAMSDGPGWFEQVAAAEGWIGYNESVGGTGFINGNKQKPPYPVRAAVIADEYDDPDAIIVQGGLNDLGRPTDEIAAAMDATLTTLSDAFPETELVVVSVFAPGGVTEPVTELRDAQRDLAAAHDAAFIDVSALFEGANADLIGRDGTHPTDAGVRLIADTLRPELGGLA